MISARVPLLAAALILGPVLADSGLRAQGGGSPFLPPAVAAAAAGPAQDAALELRGITSVGDSQMFSIYNPAKKMSAWTKLNEPGRDYIVRSYDQAKDSVTVDFQGRTLSLALRTAKVVSAPAMAAPAPGGPPNGPGPQPVGGPVVLNPTPADEQRRLEAIAAEVNRRRQLRQQAMQAGRATAGQVTPQTPQPPVQAPTPPPNQR